MVDVNVIRDDEDYEAALARVDLLMDAEPGSAEADELAVLSTLVDAYETEHHDIELPDPISAIQFRMEQEGLSNRDLIPYLGSAAKVSEILSGKRDLTLPMIRALNRHLGIPAEVLIQEPGGTIPPDNEGIEWFRFPVMEMIRRGFLETRAQAKENAEWLMRRLIDQAGGLAAIPVPLFRKNNGARRNAKMDSYALLAWCAYVLAEARKRPVNKPYQRSTVSPKFLRTLATLSAQEDGPVRACEVLRDNGIILIVAPHLSNTYLDGAAMLLPDGTPVIGMTLRYDRIDNFWFCLLHELAHIGRHMIGEGETLFVDDLDLEVDGEDQRELEADEWAQDALIPPIDWDEHPAFFAPTVGNVVSLAQRVSVHPAIVAGRIRRKLKNYKLLSQLVGAGEVRKHFDQKWG